MSYIDATASPPRRYLLAEANLRQLQERQPRVAVLPWGATEAHNYHLPHGTDFIVATAYAHHAAKKADAKGAQVIALPTIPFGNNAQQIDQVATIHCSTTTAYAILQDVCHSLTAQGIDRLVILNCHGGNEFKPLIRDLEEEFKMLIVQVNGFGMVPELRQEIFPNPGSHAGDCETSVLLHIAPHLVELEHAGKGASNPFTIPGISQPGVWTPRPWAHTQPDTGAGDPRGATSERGKRYFEAVTDALSDLLVGLAAAKKGDLPYI